MVVAPWLATHHPDSRMILQVHDELIIEAPTDTATAIAQAITTKMEHVVTLSVPLTVDASVGANWGEIH